MHPNGGLFIISKGLDFSRLTMSPSKLLGEMDFAAISSDRFLGSLPTAFDFSPDGSRFLVLTYVNAFEFYIDLSERTLPQAEDLVEGVDFHEIPLEMLPQQESIAYLGEDAFLYSTEAVDGTARMMRVRCRL